MAAFAQTTNFLVSIKRVMEIWNNSTNKIMIEQIMVLINTEFAAMASAGLAGYTVTTGLSATLLQKLNNMSNNTMRLCMQNFLTYLLTEFAAVETNGLAYTVTADVATEGADAIGAVTGMRMSMYNWPNSTHRTGFDQIIDILSTELTALQTAS
jgi:hypothetical protein